MIFRLIPFTIALCVFGLGCSASELNDTSSESPTPQETVAAKQGQMLPIDAIAILGGEEIELEVTRTPEQQALGLMFRENLPDNRGMLFSFDPPQEVNFWMMNVKISLDMVFLREGKIVAIARDVPPCKSEPCPTYGPPQPIDRVIELRGGRAEELGLGEGDSVVIDFKH
ncbi:DUF192 domain-containing protein [Lusitaniella coriacea LEGE 07157]|uniref:DUF192 domain-containing protein n=1 Tax=Lusitaniella coriacea LEGE 07157 TaxID=945747 RepID=A0A8J7E0K7_9CYAN|nr:DUF192 domain-containing protein [Lusitaniella coriacea]MBE9117089.1 DUF192 domain-containing protein [Lusitaniella coriacea LEGE 07157]